MHNGGFIISITNKAVIMTFLYNTLNVFLFFKTQVNVSLFVISICESLHIQYYSFNKCSTFQCGVSMEFSLVDFRFS